MKAHEMRYNDDDMLLASQVAEVWSENSPSTVSLANVSSVIRARIAAGSEIKIEVISSKMKRYRYGDIKNMVVSRSRNAGRPKKQDHEISPVAVRQRRRRARLSVASPAGAAAYGGE
jgi:hypothetical protein